MRLSILLLLLLIPAFLMPGCFDTDANLTDSGEGKPVVSIEFPPSVEPSAREVATLEVENPGPGDMEAVLVTFAVLGASDLPEALVGFGSNGENPSIVDVEPDPVAVSQDGVVYRFEGLEEGESMSIDFTILTPSLTGRYANSVTASDGTDLERAKGVPLETRVEE